MKFVFARKQAFAEEHLRALEPASLVEVARVRDEDIADLVRMRCENDGLAPNVEHRDVTVRACELREEAEWTARDGEHGLARIAASPARWCRGRLHSIGILRKKHHASAAALASALRRRRKIEQSRGPSGELRRGFPREVRSFA